MSAAAWDRSKNPYAPARRPESEPDRPRRGVLPVLRLRRLGASDRLVAGMGELWGSMDAVEREAMADDMAERSDEALLAVLVGEPPDGDLDAVCAWVEEHRFPADAARAAIVAERAKEGDVNLAAVNRIARTGSAAR